MTTAREDGQHLALPVPQPMTTDAQTAGWVPDRDDPVILSGQNRARQAPGRRIQRPPAIPDRAAPKTKNSRRQPSGWKPDRREKALVDKARGSSPWGAVVGVTRLAGGQGASAVSALLAQALALTGLNSSILLSACSDAAAFNTLLPSETPGSVADFVSAASASGPAPEMGRVVLPDNRTVWAMASPADPRDSVDALELFQALRGLRHWAGQSCTVVDLPAGWATDACAATLDAASHVVVVTERSTHSMSRAEAAVDALRRQRPGRQVLTAVTDLGRRTGQVRAAMTRLEAVSTSVHEIPFDRALAGGAYDWLGLSPSTRLAALALADALTDPEGDPA